MFIKNLSSNDQKNFIKNIITENIIYNQQTKMLDILGSNEYNISMSKYEQLYENIDSKSISNIKDDLLKIIHVFGMKDFNKFISLYFSGSKQSYDQIIQNKYFALLKHFFHITNIKEVPWKKNRSPGKIQKNRIVDDNVISEMAEQLECFDLSRNTSQFQLKINGIKVALHDTKNKKTLILFGIIDEPMIQHTDEKVLDDFLIQIENEKPDTEDFQSVIFENFKQNLTMRDLLVYSSNELHTRFMGYINQIKLFKQKSISQIVKEFIALDLYGQRTTLIQLLLKNDDKEFQYLSYLLYDLLSSDQSSGNDSYQQQKIFDSLPWFSKKFFREAMNNTVEYTNNLSNYDVAQIPIEQQICLMKTDDSVKEKAMVKLKELKSKGDDNGSKARQYLDGLLKIPFGIYKKEPILFASEDIQNSYNKIIDELKKNKIDIDIMEDKDANVITISNFIINLKDNIIPLINKKMHSNIIESFSNMKRDELIFNICNINNLIKINKIKQKKLIHSGKKSNFMKEQIYEFVNNNLNNKSIINELAIKNNDQINFYDNQFDNEIDFINDKINLVNNYIKDVRGVLDSSVYGHDRAKKQIERIIGQWINGDQTGYSFGFEGPPGVGKTSLAKKGIANCLKDEEGNSRPFAFIAIGGQDNGSSLNGHNYTYVGSEWGKFCDILIKNKCMNPIIFIDELDKISKTEHGKEIVGILTHMIDSTQNDCFQDKYFNGIDLDFSKALFIFSYNDVSSIDRILLDRIHRVKFDHLSLKDKLVITFKHVLPEIYEKMGINENVISLSEENITYIVENYTSEPGIRKLKEILFEIIGEINIQFLQNSGKNELISIPLKITNEDIKTIYLKERQEFIPTSVPKQSAVGIMNGLWANALGRGGIIPIEVNFFPSNSFLDLKLTGMQGDVMKESMNVARTLAWNLAPGDQIQKHLTDFEKYKKQGIHIHCPEGATPKDGPSAGTAITVAIHSLLTGKKIKNTIAITGEINLQGRVTAIGGLDLKILGGIRAGVKEFIFPVENKKDYNDLMEKYKDENIFESIKFHSLEKIEQVLEIVYDED
jgi:ATP-dependent Lon protease